jgi:hypothetical protein
MPFVICFFLLVQKLLAFVDMVIDIRMATVSHKQSAARTIDCSQLVFLDLCISLCFAVGLHGQLLDGWWVFSLRHAIR